MATPVMAQSVAEKTGMNTVVGIAPSTQDFVTEVAQSDKLAQNLDKWQRRLGGSVEQISCPRRANRSVSRAK
jgi:putative membrane protein